VGSTRDIPSGTEFASGDTAPAVREKLNANLGWSEDQMQGIEDRLEGGLRELIGDGVVSGLSVSAGTGLSVNVADGRAMVGHVVVKSLVTTGIAVAPNATSKVYLLQDGTFYTTAGSDPPGSQPSVLLASAVADGSGVTSVNNDPPLKPKLAFLPMLVAGSGIQDRPVPEARVAFSATTGHGHDGLTSKSVTGTRSSTFTIGDGTSGNRTIYASVGVSPQPALRYNDSTDKWQYTNDGTAWNDVGTGGDPGVPSDAVTSETGYGQSPAAGTSSEYSRGNHTHGTPTLSTEAPAELTAGSSGQAGTGDAPSRDDHTHGVKTDAAALLGGTVGLEGESDSVARADHGHEAFSDLLDPMFVADFSMPGDSPYASRADHMHQGVHSVAKSGGSQAFGDVTLAAGSNVTIAQVDSTFTIAASTGGTPSSSVQAETTYGQSPSAGSSTNYARGDHTHGSPSLSSSTPQPVGTSASGGSATAPSKADHVHVLGAGAVSAGSLVADGVVGPEKLQNGTEGQVVRSGASSAGWSWPSALHDPGGAQALAVAQGGAVWNDAGDDRDLRFEGDGDPALLVLDAGTDMVGIGVASPGEKLTLASGAKLGWDNGSGAVDVNLFRSEANVLATNDTVRSQMDGLGGTLPGTSGLQLRNSTAATGGVPRQVAPTLEFVGHGWTGSADQEQRHAIVSDPMDNNNPTFRLYVRKGAGAWTQILSIDAYGQYGSVLLRSFYDQRETTATVGFSSTNDAPATSSYDQYTPVTRWKSGGWKTGGTPASQMMSLGQCNAPEQGVTNPVGVHKWFGGTNTDTPVESNEMLRLEWGDRAQVVLNEQGLDRDLRVEGDTDQYLLCVDGGSDKVGIGVAAPTEKLTVLSTGKLGWDNGAGACDVNLYRGAADVLKTDDSLSVGKFLGFAGTAVAISSGAITASRTFHTVDTEGGASSDDLDTISGGDVGDMLILSTESSARDVTVKDGSTLRLAGDCVLGSSYDKIMLMKVTGTTWVELARSING